MSTPDDRRYDRGDTVRIRDWCGGSFRRTVWRDTGGGVLALSGREYRRALREGEAWAERHLAGWGKGEIVGASRRRDAERRKRGAA